MKMKKQTIAVLIALSLMLIGVGMLLNEVLTPIQKCTRKHQNFIADGRIVIIPVDTVDGRPIYNVLFNDEDGLDEMYPEEIANGLATGKWDYNEMLIIKERAE